MTNKCYSRQLWDSVGVYGCEAAYEPNSSRHCFKPNMEEMSVLLAIKQPQCREKESNGKSFTSPQKSNSETCGLLGGSKK